MGFYNAGFLSNRQDGGTWSSTTLGPNVPDDRDPYFEYMTMEAPFVPVDGEAYWGTPNPSKNRSLVEGHPAALRFFQHHYNTFSHHNSFWPLDPENTTGPGADMHNKVWAAMVCLIGWECNKYGLRGAMVASTNWYVLSVRSA
jgi:hypothetical protein